MPTPVSPEEHPFTAVMLHWIHLASLAVLVVTGFRIHSHVPGSAAASVASGAHAATTLIFLASALFRLAWAWMGSGSSMRGSHRRIDDWLHFRPQKGDASHALAWAKRYLMLNTEVPESDKYNPLQRFVYAVLFPLTILGLTLTGLSLSATYSEVFLWVMNLLGGEGQVRSAHFTAMWVILLLTGVHLIAAIREGSGRIMLMLFRWIPPAQRAPGDRHA